MSGTRNRPAMVLVQALLIVATLRCVSPVEPLVDGGTHTGNPDISACVTALYEALGTGDEWRVERYVAGSRLDPSSIDPNGAPVPLLKYRNADLFASQARARDTVVVDTVVDSDTILVISRRIRSDTAVVATEIADTLDSLIDGLARRYIVTYVNFDTIVSYDTLLYSDTIFSFDTLLYYRLYQGADSTSVPGMSGDLWFLDSSWTESWGVTADAAESPLVVIGGGSDTVGTRWVSALNTNYLAPSGDSVRLRYVDADGNGTLYEAAGGAVPRALFTELRVTGDKRSELICLFSAGADLNIASSADNGIDSLSYHRYTGEFLDERVVFTGGTDPINGTDRWVTVSLFAPSDSLRYQRTVYTVSADRLTRIERTRQFAARAAGLDSLSLRLDGFSKAAGATIPGGAFVCRLYSNRGAVGLLEGTIDTAVGLTGTLRWGGETYSVEAQGATQVRVEKTAP